jgi:hypothetical protein
VCDEGTSNQVLAKENEHNGKRETFGEGKVGRTGIWF